MLGEGATLADVAFAVCTALQRNGTVAVLTGGSAATYYVPEAYQSLDIDLVFRVAPERNSLVTVMAELGYSSVAGDMYEHGLLPYTVEFPRGPLAIGRDIITRWATVQRRGQVLFVTSVTDCVRDRFMHFWAWNDRSALEVALRVARTHRSEFDAAAFLEWTERERKADNFYSVERVTEFISRL